MLRKLTNAPIKWRLTIAYLAIMFFAMTAAGLVLSSLIEREYLMGYRQVLSSHAKLVKTAVEDDYRAGNPNLDQLCKELSDKINVRVQILDNNRNIIGDSKPEQGDSTNNPAGKLKGAGCLVCHPEARVSTNIAESQPIIHDGRIIGEARISTSLFGIKQASARARRIIFSALVVAALVAAVLSQRLAASISKPITDMSNVAKRMAQGDLSQRVTANGGDEIWQLAASFNTMAQQIERMLGEIAEDKDKIETILTTMADGIIVTDETGKIVLFNKASESIFQCSAADVLDKPIDDAGLHTKLSHMVRETLNARRLVRKELRLPIEQTNVTLSAYSSPVKDQSSAIKGAVVVLHDLTEIRKHEMTQKEFVANVSHELRTPITAVRVTAEALLSGAKDDPQLLDRFLTTLVKESERLSLLIDDLLEIAKREAGQRKIRRTEIDLPRLMTRIIALHRAKAEASNIGITSEVQDDLTIYADEQQIEQVISNLLDNAIKYTLQNGKVDVRAEGNGKSVTISVTDTGIGIPNNEVPRIFERFYRVDKAKSRQLGGTGLGLSIVKDIVEAHNGTITVETELGSGSTFTVSIPRNNAGNDEDEDQDHSSAV